MRKAPIAIVSRWAVTRFDGERQLLSSLQNFPIKQIVQRGTRAGEAVDPRVLDRRWSKLKRLPLLLINERVRGEMQTEGVNVMQTVKSLCVLTLGAVVSLTTLTATTAIADDNEKEHGVVQGAAKGAAAGALLPGVSARTGAAIGAATGGIKAHNDRKDDAATGASSGDKGSDRPSDQPK